MQRAVQWGLMQFLTLAMDCGVLWAVVANVSEDKTKGLLLENVKCRLPDGIAMGVHKYRSIYLR